MIITDATPTQYYRIPSGAVWQVRENHGIFIVRSIFTRAECTMLAYELAPFLRTWGAVRISPHEEETHTTEHQAA